MNWMKWIAVVLAGLFFLGLLGCGIDYRISTDDPAVGIIFRTDTGLWLQAKGTKADGFGVWVNKDEESEPPTEPEPVVEPEPEPE